MDATDEADLRQRLPARKALLWPSYEVYRDHDRPLSVQEHDELVERHLDLPHELVNVPTSNGKEREFAVRLRSVRFQLRQAGLIEQVSHGVWQITRDSEMEHPEGPDHLAALKRDADKRRRDAEKYALVNREQHDAGGPVDQQHVADNTAQPPATDQPPSASDLHQRIAETLTRIRDLRAQRDQARAELNRIEGMLDSHLEFFRGLSADAARQGITIDVSQALY